MALPEEEKTYHQTEQAHEADIAQDQKQLGHVDLRVAVVGSDRGFIKTELGRDALLSSHVVAWGFGWIRESDGKGYVVAYGRNLNMGDGSHLDCREEEKTEDGSAESGCKVPRLWR